MTQWLNIDPYYIKPRDAAHIAEALNAGKTAAIPSDSGYALLCCLGDKAASQKIRQSRALDKDHPFTIVCRDLSELSQYARVDNVQYRLLKKLFPGAYTCILPASKDAPRLLQNDKRKTIGIRVPDHPIMSAVLNACSGALMGISLADGKIPALDPRSLPKMLLNSIDIIADIGEHPVRPTTILDLTDMPPAVIRQGYGSTENF